MIGGQFVPAAITIFNSKIGSQFVYGAPFLVEATGEQIDKLFLQFLHGITGTPKAVLGVALHVELAQRSLEAQVCAAMFRFG